MALGGFTGGIGPKSDKLIINDIVVDVVVEIEQKEITVEVEIICD